ncbi:MAG: Ig-like domain-containing protein, partial [Bacillota bacterium]|nr:Ig-like domain-containing protein [Bacillota bacterium]
MSVAKGKYKTLSASVMALTDDAPTKTKLVWESSDSSIAMVSSSGKITGKSLGRCTIKVYAYDEPLIYSEITVLVVPQATKVLIYCDDNDVTGSTLSYD